MITIIVTILLGIGLIASAIYVTWESEKKTKQQVMSTLQEKTPDHESVHGASC